MYIGTYYYNDAFMYHICIHIICYREPAAVYCAISRGGCSQISPQPHRARDVTGKRKNK